MKRKVKLKLDNGGGELDSAVWSVECDIQGSVVDEGELSKRVKEQLKLWQINVGDTITVAFADERGKN